MRALAALLLCAWLPLAAAQAFPAKPLRIVVSFPPGGPIDTVARHIAAPLAEIAGQQVLVDNKPGASGLLGTDFVAKSAPDGYTMILGSTAALVISPHLYPKMPYDTLKDLQGVTLATTTPNVVVVHPSVPAKSLAELLELARKQPGKLNFASTSSGGLNHLALEIMKATAKVDIVHVPYKGAAPAVTDALGGQVQGMIADIPVLQPHVLSGRLRALALTAPKRSPALPEVPTSTEAGMPGLQATNWYGLFVPSAVARETLARLHALLVQALERPDTRAKLAAIGAEVSPSASPEQFQGFVRDEFARWGRIAKESGAKIE
jgi:tripartite-type tricarboxylate transporter receptor subunit TctC